MEERIYKGEELLAIGQNIALLWGGSCIGAEYIKKDDVYKFECIEHGERFYTNIISDQIYKYIEPIE